MAIPTDRNTFQDKCMRALGFPVVEVNIDEDQIGDCIDDALDKYWEAHFDGTQKLYLKHQFTANDIANTSVTVPNNITAITRIFPIFSALTSTINMFDVRYQYMLQSLPNFTSLSLVDYEITMMHLENINQAFNGIPGIRFNKVTNTLYLDIDWTNKVQVGSFIIIECYAKMDPDANPQIWSDKWLRKYATALLKRQWGTNMKKFNGVALVGGIMLNGQQIYDEAVNEVTALELELDSMWTEPPRFLMG